MGWGQAGRASKETMAGLPVNIGKNSSSVHSYPGDSHDGHMAICLHSAVSSSTQSRSMNTLFRTGAQMLTTCGRGVSEWSPRRREV